MGISYGWPDIIIVVAAIISAHGGWKRGFVTELGGMIAIVVAIVAAISYPGYWDWFIIRYTRLGPGSAHVLAMSLFALAWYALVALLASLLTRYSKHKFVGPINAFGGAVTGIAKTAVLFWAILYVGLFFPLSPDLRSDLRTSFFIPYLTSPNARLDANIRPTLPWFVRPFSGTVFARHRL